MARVRKYDSRKQGLEYTLKCLNVTNGGANLYEVGKFSHSADEVMLSNSIWNPAESQPGLGYACHCLVERSAAVDSTTPGPL
jgi:hypothetical protein